MENHAVIKRLAMHSLAGFRVLPVLLAGGEANEIGYGFGSLFGKQFTL